MDTLPRPSDPARDSLAMARQNSKDATRSVNKIAKSGAANLLGAGLSAVSSFLLVVLISRLWDPETAGLIFAVSSIFLIALALSEIGVDQGLVRFIAWNNARDTPRNNKYLIRHSVCIALFVSVLVMALGLFFAHPLARVLSGGGAETIAAQMIVVFALALPIAASYELTLAITRGLTHMKPTIVIERVVRPLLQVVLVLGAALLGSGAAGSGALALAIAWVAPYTLALLCALVMLWRTMRKNPDTFGTGRPEAPREVATEFWRFTIPRGVARLAQVGLQRADIAVVTIVAGPAAAAMYTAVTRFLVLGQLATTALQQVSEPHLAKLLAKDNHKGAKLVTQQLTLWTVSLAWPIYLVFVILAERLLSAVFGTDFAVGADSLRILCVAMLFATSIGPLDMLLLMAGRSSLSLINTVTALAVDVVGCLLLVPVLGIVGAAIAWAAAIVVRNVMCFVQVRRTLGISPVSRHTAYMTGGIVVIFLAFPFLWFTLLPGTPLLDVAAIAISAAGYAAFLWWRRESLIPRG